MDDVAVIFDNEAFYTDVFADYAAAYRFAELPVSRKLADAVVKALLLGKATIAHRKGRICWLSLSSKGRRFMSSGRR
ncbi:TPA: hypothetical protein SAY52_005988 [Burkholderia cenocepacia]|uniref:hypothetical protein n=1 Tax=unclassified Burkholderia TaxID=2613784 RepID=UPI001FC86DA4|nr:MULTISPECIES: hypothetical protein [unclassified Burkholderia]HEF5875288.1 hypothetical protein [Burkholderia cenocepacia]